MKTIYIRDDLGHAWTFDGQRVYNVLAEMERTPNNGYPCQSWGEAIALLNKLEYITGFDEPETLPALKPDGHAHDDEGE